MKKNISCFFIFVLLITNSFLAVGQPFELIPKGHGWGSPETPYFQQLNPPERNLLDLGGKGVGGVVFSSIAAPLGNAVGKPLALRYDPAKTDGNRLEVLVGDTVINSRLYDWELVPLVRFVESDSWACASLIGAANENDSISLFENALEMCGLKADAIDDIESIRELFLKSGKLQTMQRENKTNSAAYLNLRQEFANDLANLSARNRNVFDVLAKNIMWASYNPGMGNTLVGINLILVDAMLVGGNNGPQNINRIISLVNDFPKISGYNDKPVTQIGPSEELLSILAEIKEGNYIFSDDGLPMYYWVNGNEIKFSSFPYYQFMKKNNAGSYEFIPELNDYMRLHYSEIKALNPVIFNAAEKWCHWSALFRAVEKNNGAEWSRFVNSIAETYPYFPNDPEKTVYPEPSFITPRFWLRR